MKSRTASLIMALILMMGTSSTCFSQSMEKIRNLEEFLGKNVTELSSVHMNLIQMNVSQIEPYLDSTVDSVNSAIQFIDKVIIYTQVYSIITNETDRRRVRTLLRIQAKYTKKVLDINIGSINSHLVRFQSQAVTSEVQKARDLVIKIRAEIEKVVPVE